MSQVIAHNSRSDEIVKLRKTFQKYDTAKNGVLSFDEFKAALHESDISDEMLQEVFESIVRTVYVCMDMHDDESLLTLAPNLGRKQDRPSELHRFVTSWCDLFVNRLAF